MRQIGLFDATRTHSSSTDYVKSDARSGARSNVTSGATGGATGGANKLANKNSALYSNNTADDHVKATVNANVRKPISTGGCYDNATTYSGLYNIAFYPDFYSWWHSAMLCLEQQLDPSTVWWTEDTKAPCVTRKRLPRRYDGFVQDATAASCHRSDDRWGLLYSLLWRLTHNEPQLMELSGDPEVTRLRKYAKAVARDVHKMKAFVRFRKIESPDSGSGSAPHQDTKDASESASRYVSWFEPQHFIVEYAAPFFKRRFSNMHWSILTPMGCAHWETGGNLWFSDPVDKSVAPENDQFEEAWRVYYKSIFNPARLKTNAMQSEMPKKYWKNLPEAKEISALVESAEDRTREMISQRKTSDNFHCGSRPEHPNQTVRQQIHKAGSSSLEALKLQASLCTRCPQSDTATQTVFGEGPDNARLMIIGEQPGDKEDLHGRPFVGPAAKVLNAALKQAGIDRDSAISPMR